MSYATLESLLSLSEPQFLHLQGGNHSGTTFSAAERRTGGAHIKKSYPGILSNQRKKLLTSR